MVGETKLVSVVIPAYNAADIIRSCLNSLLRQSYSPLEVIVVDDGSDDDTFKVVKQFKKVTLLSQKHFGAGSARNKGAFQAKGNILVFADADQEFAPDFVADLVKPILKGKAKGSWTGNEVVKNWENVWAKCFNYNFGRYSKTMIGDTKSQRKVFRAILKKEFDKVHGFDSIGYNDDWTLVNKLGYQPKTTRALIYHYHPDNLNKVFSKAIFMGQRDYKLAWLGSLITLLRHNAGFSLIVGTVKALKTKTPVFVIFKLVFDLGLSLGVLLSLFGRRYH